MMSKTVADIAVRVGADVTPLVGGMARGGRSLDRFGDKAAKARRQQELMTKATRLGAAALLAAAAAAVTVVKQAIAVADSIDKASRAANIGAEKLQTLRFAGEQSGIAMEKMDGALAKFNITLGRMSSGMETSSSSVSMAFAALGMSADEMATSNRSTEESLDLVMERLAGVTDGAEQAAIAAQLFGKSAGPQMRNLLAQGIDGLLALEDQAKNAVGVIDQALITRGVEISDKWNLIMSGMATTTYRFALSAATHIDNLFGFTVSGQEIKLKESLEYQKGMIIKAEADLESERERFARSALGGGGLEIGKREQDIRVLKADLMATVAELAAIELEISERKKQLREQAKVSVTNETVDLGDPLAPGTLGGSSALASMGLSQADLDALREGIMTEAEILDARYADHMAKLLAFHEQGLMSEQEYNEQVEASKKDHNAAMDQLDAARKGVALSSLGGMFGDLATLMSSKNKQLFMIGKAASIANATITGYEAAVDAWGKGMKIGGPPVAALFAGASIVKTGAQIAQIASTNFGGSGGNRNVGGSGVAPSAAVASAGGGGGQQALTTYNLGVHAVDGQVSEKEVRSVFEKLAEGTRNGGILVNSN